MFAEQGTRAPRVSRAERAHARTVALQERDLLRALIRVSGVVSSILFVLIGLGAELQLYADGALFSYGVAAESGWELHWHNISGRLFVYLLAHLPAEAYVALTRDAAGGVALYGLLFFSTPLLGLTATWLADRTRQRRLFTAACLSTACLCPLVFGFPTEMWIAHSLFWPTLALAQCARRGIPAALLTTLAMVALVHTHEGAVVLAGAIVGAMMLNGPWSHQLYRAAAAMLLAIVIWASIKLTWRPDAYFATVLARAALSFLDLTALATPIVGLLSTAVVASLVAGVILRNNPIAGSALAVPLILAAGLIAYWLWLDHSLHGEERYPLRTVLLLVTPVLGCAAILRVVHHDPSAPGLAIALSRLASRLGRKVPPTAAAGALGLVMLVHGVETAKLVLAWESYKTAVAELATRPIADPWLGDARFVSSQRIPAAVNRLSWHSTTQYLSVLLAPEMRPRRLVVHPDAGYHWMSCPTAIRHEERDRAVPLQSRELLRRHACQHRRY
jgi:hypothetical protein